MFDINFSGHIHVTMFQRHRMLRSFLQEIESEPAQGYGFTNQPNSSLMHDMMVNRVDCNERDAETNMQVPHK